MFYGFSWLCRPPANAADVTTRYNLYMDDTVISRPLRFGDHLQVKRRLYTHHGIYIGNHEVIHYAPPPGNDVGDGIGWRQILGADSVVNTIHVAALEDFEFEDVPASVVPYDDIDSYPPLKTVARAQSRIGENGYNLWGNNCEQFSRWCKQAQPQGAPVNLWESTWEGALLGFSAGSRARQWSTMALGAGLGALFGVTKKWLQGRTLVRANAEFASFSSALYFGLANKFLPLPFGRSFQHASQLSPSNIAVASNATGNEILFVYRGAFFQGSSRKDWRVTERAIIREASNQLIDFHDIESIGTLAGGILITTLVGKHHRFPCRYINAKNLASFLMCAISGSTFEMKGNGRTMSGRIKDAILGPNGNK